MSTYHGVRAFNQEKALVGAFSVTVKTDCEIDGSFYSTNQDKLEQLVAGVLDIAQLVRGQHGTSGGLEEDLRAVTGRQVSCDWSRATEY